MTVNYEVCFVEKMLRQKQSKSNQQEASKYLLRLRALRSKIVLLRLLLSGHPVHRRFVLSKHRDWGAVLIPIISHLIQNS